MNIEKGNIIFSCKHLFCNDCWIAYIKDKIESNQVIMMANLILDNNFYLKIILQIEFKFFKKR